MNRVAERRAGQHQNNQSVYDFEGIYKLCGARILRLAYRFTWDQEQARDVTQDVFLKVYEHMEEFRNESEVYTWVHRIAVNHMLNFLRRERRKKWYDIMDQRIGAILREESSKGRSDMSSPSLTPHQVMEQAEREKTVWEAIESLAPKYRIPFVLFRFEEMSYQQIADSMSLSLSAVEARIHRAKKQLIKKLEPVIEHI